MLITYFIQKRVLLLLKRHLNEQDIIAVAFRQEGLSTSASDDLFYGEFLATGDTNTTKKISSKDG